MNVDAAELLVELVEALERRPDLAERVRAVLAPANEAPPECIYATPTQAAERFGVSRRTLFTWLALGLPCVGSGRTRRVDIVRATVWLRERAQTDDAIEQRARRDAARAARKAAS